MHLRTRTASLIALAGAAALVVAGSAGATADPSQQTLNHTVLGPFQIALSNGSVYYTDGFQGTVSKIAPGADPVIASVQGEIAGVDLSHRGRVLAFTSSTQSGTSLTIRRAGQKDVVADLSGYESSVNPDRHVTYGIIRHGNPCARKALSKLTGGPATYQGQVDSHPYQVTYLTHGSYAVADAAGNAILRVGPHADDISTIAVLPRQPVRITKAQAKALGAPDCVAGVTYAFEPVPTDVEKDGHGGLLVSTLPGGPEDASLGARGSVYRIAPGGRVSRVATGFAGATNLAVDREGAIFVTEHFAGKLTELFHGHRSTVAEIPRVVSVEAQGHNLYVGQLADVDFSTNNVRSPGRIILIRR